MGRFFSFFNKTSPIILIIICVVVGLIAKLLERYSANVAMGLQTLTFILFMYALIKFFDSKFK